MFQLFQGTKLKWSRNAKTKSKYHFEQSGLGICKLAVTVRNPLYRRRANARGLTCEIGVNLERRAEAGLLRRCGSSRGSAGIRMRSGIVGRIISRRSPSLLATAPSRPCWACHDHHSDTAKDDKARQRKAREDLSLSLSRMRRNGPRACVLLATKLAPSLTHSRQTNPK